MWLGQVMWFFKVRWWVHAGSLLFLYVLNSPKHNSGGKNYFQQQKYLTGSFTGFCLHSLWLKHNCFFTWAEAESPRHETKQRFSKQSSAKIKGKSNRNEILPMISRLSIRTRMWAVRNTDTYFQLHHVSYSIFPITSELLKPKSYVKWKVKKYARPSGRGMPWRAWTRHGKARDFGGSREPKERKIRNIIWGKRKNTHPWKVEEHRQRD